MYSRYQTYIFPIESIIMIVHFMMHKIYLLITFHRGHFERECLVTCNLLAPD